MENYIQPTHIKEYNIYDIYYNDNGNIIIIMPPEQVPPLKIQYYDDEKYYDFQLYNCPHKHTYIYYLETPYKKNIELVINKFIKLNIPNLNKYPEFNNEIIYSTIVKDEDNYIKQWIDFHFNLGVSRFIIYDNSDKYNLGNILNDYILKKIVILIKWSYPYRLEISGISRQTTQQNHSIYAFQNCKYIGLFDIDEYVNIQYKNIQNKSINNINDFFENLIIENNIDVNTISSFRLLNKFFYNPHNLPTDNNNFLKIINCDNIRKNGHEKNFVIPKNLKTFAVHMVTDGLPMYTVDETFIYFNHYYFLNKGNYRGLNQTDITDDSILSVDLAILN